MNAVFHVGIMCVVLFVLIYLLTLLTPWLAKYVDKWIENYHRNHSVEKDPTYGVRSIYELPPKKTDTSEKEESPQEKKSAEENK
jgi:hypothetical protein